MKMNVKEDIGTGIGFNYLRIGYSVVLLIKW